MNRNNNTNNTRFHFDNYYWDNPPQYDPIALYQIGDICCQGGYIINEHVQCCYEISYIVSGKGNFSIDGKKYNVGQGDIFLDIPKQVHMGQADMYDPFRYLYMGFVFNSSPSEENPFSHLQVMMDKLETPVKQDRLDIRTPFLNIMNEIQNVGDYSHFMIKSYINQILALTYRNFFSNWESRYMPKQEKEDNRAIVYRAITYIESNIYQIDDLKQVADALGYSYSYLSHIFSQETGMTLKNYYLKKRMTKAAELLKYDENNITAIAEMLKYQSIHSFSNAFKKTFGVSPVQYQHLNKKSK